MKKEIKELKRISSFNVEINSEAPVKVSKALKINKEASEIFKKLTDLEGLPSWFAALERVNAKELKEGSKIEFKFKRKRVKSEVHTFSKGEYKLGWTGRAIGIRAVHNWEVVEDEGGAVVFVDQSLEGPLAHLFANKFKVEVNKKLELWTRNLKYICERGLAF